MATRKVSWEDALAQAEADAPHDGPQLTAEEIDRRATYYGREIKQMRGVARGDDVRLMLPSEVSSSRAISQSRTFDLSVRVLVDPDETILPPDSGPMPLETLIVNGVSLELPKVHAGPVKEQKMELTLSGVARHGDLAAINALPFSMRAVYRRGDRNSVIEAYM